ncbi:hypothetical protein TREMEDRAFT_10950, partial [Tremella mesenterica DSM 1558]|uniref:uncharacterized protein n=1 Tax=Tremella mesenterica (strain ATCC 24925 / CBS 8224 / DSM 1558 / NBRC 9311 / NRRL Y-6157 / RJB 2259-6 / UBC 559-6) TaxID=578456 RepID=UPI0003F492B5
PDSHQRRPSENSSLHPLSIISASSDQRRSNDLSPSWAQQSQEPAHWVQQKLRIHHSHLEHDDESSIQQDDEAEEWEEDEEEVEVNESQFFNPAFISEMALQVKDKVSRGRHVKAGITWVGSFTGRDVVTAIQNLLPWWTRESPPDRRFALIVAHSLQNQLWFVEVDWDIKPLYDSSEDVYRFMGELDGMGGGDVLTDELPKGVMTMATRCYSPSCTGDSRCYAPRCPYRTPNTTFLVRRTTTPAQPTPKPRQGEWKDEVDPVLLQELSPQQLNRQNIIRQAIASEVQYEADLTALVSTYIDSLRQPQTPELIPPERCEQFISDVFSNIFEVLESCRRLIDHFSIRQREQPIILSVGDIFLQAAAEFRDIYPEYTGNLPNAETVLKRELDENAEFRLFCERSARDDRRREIKHLIARPSMQLQRYPAVIEAMLTATEPTDPDWDFLSESLASIRNLSSISQLKLFHASKGRGPAGKLQWYDLVPEGERELMEKKEQRRQMQIWELIQGEMEYVADLETLDTLFVNGLRESDHPIIERGSLDNFLDDVFHNYRSLLEVHSHLLENFQQRQLEQHPHYGMISDLILDATLNWQDAYMEYVTHYPIAKAKVRQEIATNPKFAQFLDACLKDPRSNRQDIYHFIYRPIPRLLRYNLLLADILKSLKEVAPPNDPDIETIPQVMELIDNLGKATQTGVAINELKVELLEFSRSLDGSKFGPRTVKDLDLLDPTRELIHRGKLYRQPEGPISSSWIELFGLLFDNYFVIVKQEKTSKASRKDSTERPARYTINRRPIPLELLSLGNFTDGPRARAGKTIFSVGGGGSHETEGQNEQASDKNAWPFTISFIGQGQLGGQYILWTESAAARTEWQEKLKHAKVLRNEVDDAGKVFEMTPLITPDGRSLVAVGCEEGVWIGLRSDPTSLRRVLHVRSVTNVAVLEDFGIFLVLHERSLLAYTLEALVPSAANNSARATPQRLSSGKDIIFFTVGQFKGLTLVLYMKKKGVNSLFRVLEPIHGRNAEDSGRRNRPFGGLLGQRTDWFRVYKDFFIPTDAINVHFLKHKLAVVCAKGFEIMDLTDLKGGEPNRDYQVIEWEGRPDSVAFHPPYLLLISAPFIEIRHIDTAKLIQIYTGSDIRLTWDGTGGQSRPFVDNPGVKGYGAEISSQEPRIHICQRAPRRKFDDPIEQHVFELTPTLLLNNPLLNPIHTHDSNYFPPAPM